MAEFDRDAFRKTFEDLGATLRRIRHTPRYPAGATSLAAARRYRPPMPNREADPQVIEELRHRFEALEILDQVRYISAVSDAMRHLACGRLDDARTVLARILGRTAEGSRGGGGGVVGAGGGVGGGPG